MSAINVPAQQRRPASLRVDVRNLTPAFGEKLVFVKYILVRRQGYALSEVARYFARDLATIGTLIGRLSGRMEEDERMRRAIETLTKKVEI